MLKPQMFWFFPNCQIEIGHYHWGPRWLFLRLWDEQRWGPAPSVENRQKSASNVPFRELRIGGFSKSHRKSDGENHGGWHLWKTKSWSLFFSNSAVRHRFSLKYPFQFCFKKQGLFDCFWRFFFVSNVFSVEIFISAESTTDEAREALPKLERPPLRVVHMGAGRVMNFQRKKPTAVKNNVLNSSTTEQLETKDIQRLCSVFLWIS